MSWAWGPATRPASAVPPRRQVITLPRNELLPGPSAGEVRSRHEKAFSATADQVGQARQFLAGIIGDRPASDEAILCLSELVSNAVLHSGSRHPGGMFTVRVTVGRLAMHIEVTDQGGPWSGPHGDLTCGRGLTIVATLAGAWGVVGGQDGRTVWCELTVTHPRPPHEENGSRPMHSGPDTRGA